MRRNSGGKGFRARRSLSLVAGWAAGLFLFATAAYGSPLSWPQWGRDPGHTGAAPVAGQPLAAILADIVYDPFAAAEIAEGGGSLFVHYAAPLVDGSERWPSARAGLPMRTARERRPRVLTARANPEAAIR